MSIIQTMTTDHRLCDDLFAKAEALVSQGDWGAAGPAFTAFRNRTDNHFVQEETVLFPAFEAKTGHTMGPTQMMRSEHSQMRQLFDDMATALGQQDNDLYLGTAETLMMIMQQHNVKEEQMLYPMTEQVLGEDAAAVLDRIDIS
jgi:hemerythrin-like domain-containing protein